MCIRDSVWNLDEIGDQLNLSAEIKALRTQAQAHEDKLDSLRAQMEEMKTMLKSLREARVVHRALLSAHGPVVTPHEAAIQRAISGLKSKNRIENK